MIENKYMCSGCSACAAVCPVNCISMVEDKMGFKYPLIEIETCTNCDLCKTVCPKKNKLLFDLFPQESYAMISKNEFIRKDSSSGGIFGILANYILSEGGVVFGAAFDENFYSVKHIMIESKDDLIKLQGSKYVQSCTEGIYCDVKLNLEQGKLVLFSGTMCQIAGIKHFLGKEYQNLILVDVVCHGVPAPNVWKEYIEWLELKYGGQVVSAFFRDKRKGWRDYVINIEFDNGKSHVKSRKDDLYMQGFLHDYYLRPSCYQCEYKKVFGMSDLTLGDLWGVEEICPEMDDNKGISLMVISSSKGKWLFEKVNQYITHKEIDLNYAIAFNPAIVKSAEGINKYNYFEKIFKTKPISVILRNIGIKPIHIRIASKIKNLLVNK